MPVKTYLPSKISLLYSIWNIQKCKFNFFHQRMPRWRKRHKPALLKRSSVVWLACWATIMPSVNPTATLLIVSLRMWYIMSNQLPPSSDNHNYNTRTIKSHTGTFTTVNPLIPSHFNGTHSYSIWHSYKPSKICCQKPLTGQFYITLYNLMNSK